MSSSSLLVAVDETVLGRMTFDKYEVRSVPAAVQENDPSLIPPRQLLSAVSPALFGVLLQISVPGGFPSGYLCCSLESFIMTYLSLGC